MPPKFQPTRGGARRRVERADNTHHLRDENTNSEGKIQEVGTSKPTTDGSSSSSDNEATSSPTEDTEPIRGDIIKGKTPGFRDNLHWQVKGDEKHFQEGLTRGHLKRTIMEEVRIISSEFLEYGDIEAKYKFYGLGWMSEAPGGDNNLAVDRAVLVAILVSRFPLNIGAIITEKMNCRAVKLSTSLPFPCLITRLCREAHVPILAGIDVETYATKKR
ncbi:hypothetical protein HAX54_045735 [Datura stramonium]|uniref:Putative plant transposon protein domain-containing protein n=1 Tax=Datura stramonium TaxID=4076 RepID=A0ABS8WKW3_DATST|nr:hypothetical protein [Datura stramonium]